MTIELLYFDGCPNHEALLARLGELLGDDPSAVTLRRIADAEAAERERFLGSPTVRVDGRDIEPGADERDDYGLKRRLDRTDEGLAGMPPDEWLLQALARARWSAGQRVAALSRRERELYGRILRTFATGSTPSGSRIDAWAAELGLDPSQANTALAGHDLVHRDRRTGAVAVAYPFSTAQTRHRVRLRSGVEVFAMCAIDALGIAFMLREPTEIVSADPGTGEPIEVSVTLTAANAWSPAEAVVLEGCAGTGASHACTCPHTNFAASREHARAWLEADAGVAGDILSMPDAIIRAREGFDKLLDHDPPEATDADADRA